MRVAFVLGLLGCTLLGAFLTYLAWFNLEQHRRYLHWFARLHDGWNPEQAQWIRSEFFAQTMRVSNTLFFVLSLASLCYMLLQN